MHKKMDKQSWNNLTDGMEGKTVQLREENGNWSTYNITSQMTFNIDGIVQNQTFGVFICKIVPKNTFIDSEKKIAITT